MPALDKLDLDEITKAFRVAKQIPGPIVGRILVLAREYEAADDEDRLADLDVDGMTAEFASLCESLEQTTTELRPWELSEDGGWYDEIVLAKTAKAALDIAESLIDESCYSTDNGTIWLEIGARCAITGEDDGRKVALNPDVLVCTECEHDWKTPSFCGDIGHGGGVISRSVCAHCGIYEIADSWAQDRETGEQGLHSVAYREADDISLAYVLKKRLYAQRDELPPSRLDEHDVAVQEVLGVNVSESYRNIRADEISHRLSDIDDINDIIDAVDKLLNPTLDDTEDA